MDLRNQESHFDFGLNWRSFLSLIDKNRIAPAMVSMERLCGSARIHGSFLDIGSGSGLSSLAALLLGAKDVFATDIDPNSTAATTELLSTSGHRNWRSVNRSVFDLSPEKDGRFDVVYSWGVLHHTGDMWEAIRAAAKMTANDGLFILAIYRKTWLCGFWKWEKRAYTRWRALRSPAGLLYKTVFALASAAAAGAGRRPARGMDWSHDVHDWLGGFPYESAAPSEIIDFITPLGFRVERTFVHPNTWVSRTGIFGSGCDEFVFRRSI